MLVDYLKQKLEPLRAEYTAAMADGKLTFAEAWKLMRVASRTAVQLAQGFGALTGAEKKAGVMDALTWLYDQVAGKVKLPSWLYVLSWVSAGGVRAVVLFAIDQLVESAVDHLKAASLKDAGAPPPPSPDAA